MHSKIEDINISNVLLQMNSQTKMSEQRKQQIIDIIINGFINYLKNIAACGRTSYTFDTVGITPEITKTDLIDAFKVKFPNCKFTYEEILQKRFINMNSVEKIHKKVIIIDWS